MIAQPQETLVQHTQIRTFEDDVSRDVATNTEPQIGQIIGGRYRIEACIGRGGMGSVYRVEHTHMHKHFALKLLHHEMSVQPEVVARFEREAMAAAHIEHPHVASAIDFGKLEDGSFYLVLEYVEGRSLRSVLEQQGALPLPRVFTIANQILSALARAHQLGIVHRDLKPENILMVNKENNEDYVKILDFGIARVPIGSFGTQKSTDRHAALTQIGMVYGTPEYMAPEQALGQPVDERCDLYSLGVLLFEMLTGTRPYDDEDKVVLLGQHIAGEIPLLSTRAPHLRFPVLLQEFITTLLAKSPNTRFANAVEVTNALHAINLNEFIRKDSSSTFKTNPTKVYALAALGLVSLCFALSINMRWIHRSLTPGQSNFMSNMPIMLTPAFITFEAPKGIANESKMHLKNILEQTSTMPLEQRLSQLQSLRTQYPQNTDVLSALMDSYATAKKYTDAMHILEQALQIDPKFMQSPNVYNVVRDAIQAKETTELIFQRIENSKLGEVGPRVLFEILQRNLGSASLRARATQILSSESIQSILEPAIRSTFALSKSSHNCKEKRALLEKHRSDFDARALPYLRPLLTRRGCGGFFRMNDCWPCLRNDQLVENLIKEIEQRSQKKM